MKNLFYKTTQISATKHGGSANHYGGKNKTTQIKTINHWLIAIALLAGIVGLQGVCFATDYYVGPNGNDANDGTLERPLLTLWQAFYRARQPGDKILLLSGTIVVWDAGYRKAETFGGGVEGNPIVMESAPGASSLVDMSTGEFNIKHPYWVIRGLRFAGGGMTVPTKHVVIEECEFKGAWSVLYTGAFSSEDVTFRRNTVWFDRPDASSIMSFRSPNSLIEHNVFHFTVDNSTSEAALMFKANACNIEVRYNQFIVHPGVQKVPTAVYLGSFYTGWVTGVPESIDVRVHDNLFWNYRNGVFYLRSVKDVSIYHNTIYSAGQAINQWRCPSWTGVRPEGTVFKNNIIYAESPNALLDIAAGTETGFVSDHNVWYSPSGAPTVRWLDATVSFAEYVARSGQDVHSLVVDPLFVNLAEDYEQSDLRLKSNSPAIDKGEYLKDFNSPDLAGIPRPQGNDYDIGSYEMPGENTPPSAITALIVSDKPNDDGTRIILDWAGFTPPGDFDHYNIYRYTSSFNNVSGMTPIFQLDYEYRDVKSYTDTTAQSGTNYYYAVTVTDVSGQENKSFSSVGPVQAVNNGDTTPQAITNLIVQDTPNDTGQSIDLDWTGCTPPSDFKQYNIYRKTSYFDDIVYMQPVATITNPVQTTFTDINLDERINIVEYYYVVTCVDQNGNEIRNVTPKGPVKSVNNFRPWPGGRLAAVSLGYDDDNVTSYNDRNNLARYGFKATYFVNSGTIGQSGKMTWEMVQQLYDEGHEISSHTHLHKEVININHIQLVSDEKIIEEHDSWFEYMKANTTIPEEDFKQSFAYPYGYYSDHYAHNILPQYYHSARTVDVRLADRPPSDLYLLPAYRNETEAWSQQLPLVDKAIAEGKWIIFFSHGTYHPAFLDALAARNVWVATQGEVVKHLLGESPEPPPTLPGDIDGDGDVDLQDLLIVAKGYGVTYDLQDLLLVAMHYGEKI